VWEAIARAVPERTAQIRGSRRSTWGEFEQRAEALAQHFVDSGLQHGARVGALLYNAPEYLETLFATFKIGLTPFNVNYRYGPDELLYLLNDADAEALVFHASFAPTLERIRERVPSMKRWIAVAEPGSPLPEWASEFEPIASRKPARRAA